MDRANLNPLKDQEVQCTQVLVVGGIGHGKSSIINSVLKTNECEVGQTWGVDETITKEVQAVNIQQNGEMMTFIDTPSLWTLHSNLVFQELFKIGFHAIVVVWSINSSEPRSPVLQEIKNLFGDDVYRHTLIVLTFEDCLEEYSVQEFLSAYPDLQEFTEKTGNNCIPFNNKLEYASREASKQRKNILLKLNAICRKNEYQVIKRKEGCPKLFAWFQPYMYPLYWFKNLLSLEG